MMNQLSFVNLLKKIIARIDKYIGYFGVKYIFVHYYMYRKKLKKLFKLILSYDSSALGFNEKDQEEQALPGMKKYRDTGYFKYMLGRYSYCLKFAKNKRVLDAGSGLGWGSYIISQYTDKIIAIDISEKSISFSKTTWKDKAHIYRRLSVLELDKVYGEFDCMLCMEVIEHLSREDAETFIRNVYWKLKKGGRFIMSSYFPLLEASARQNLRMNKFHLYIWRRREIKKFLRKIGFSRITILGACIVNARK